MPRGDHRVDLTPAQKGFRNDLPRHLVPDGYLVDGQNVVCRDGAVIVRPGVQKLTAVQPTTNRIMGGIYYKDSAGSQNVIVASTTGFFLWQGASWADISGTALTGDASNQVVFTMFPFGTTSTVIAVNDTDPPQSYTGTGTFGTLGGSPPVAKTCCTAFNRVILANLGGGLARQPSTLRISDFGSPSVWPVLNTVTLTDTNDQIVSIATLSNQAFAIYKEQSQWIGIGAANIFPFIFELRDRQPGPVSANAVVVAERAHYYVGLDGDIYRFDGNKCEAIGGPVKRLIQSTVDWSTISRTCGFYDRLNREIWWFFPGASSSAGITYRVEYGDIPGAFSPLMTYAPVVSAAFQFVQQTDTWDGLAGTWDALSMTFPQWDSFQLLGKFSQLVGAGDGTVFQFGKAASDDGTNITAYWDSPLRPLTGTGENIRVDTIESFFKQFVQSQAVQILLRVSDTLADDGTLQGAQTVDIGAAVGTKLRATFYDTQARFIAVRHQMTGAVGLVPYRGSVLYAYKRGES